MYTRKFTIKPFCIALMMAVSALVMVSCGTQNQAYNENDGIYASGTRNSQEDNSQVEDPNGRSNYYKQYFESKTIVYGDLSEQDEGDLIFTDIEAYTTSERLDEDGNIIIEENYDDGYGGWGINSESLTVNIYNTGGYGYGYGFWHRPYYSWYGGYWGYPYSNYYGPYWGMSFGWGWN